MTIRITETTRRAQADRDYLCLSGLQAPLQDLLADFSVLSANGAAILAQPDLTLALLQTLPQDQSLLRTHVSMYRDDLNLSGGILAAFQSVSTIASGVCNAAKELAPVAARLDEGEHGRSYTDDLTTFRTALERLSDRTTSPNPAVYSPAHVIRDAHTALRAFANSQLTDDATRFETAVAQAPAGGGIDRLTEQVAALQQQIDKLNGDIAAGATSQIVPALKFGFSIGKIASAAMTDPGKLVLNVGFAIKGEVDRTSKWVKEMDKKNSELNKLIGQYRDLVQSLAQAEQEMSIILTIKGHCDVFRDNVSTAVSTLAIVLGQVQLLHNGIGALCVVDAADEPNFFSNQLASALAAWGDLGQICAQDLQLARALSSD